MTIPFTGGCPSWHNPTMDIWTSKAQPWDHLDPNRLRYARGFE